MTNGTDGSGEQSTSPSAPLLPRHIHRGWWIVLAGAGVLTLISYADLNLADYVFEPPDTDGMRSSSARAIGLVISLLLLLPFRLFVGSYIDRHGPLVPISAALTIGGSSYIVLGLVGPSWVSYNMALFVGSAVTTTASIALLVTVANLFARHVGLAFAIALIGVSAGTWGPIVFGNFFLLALSRSFDGFGAVHMAIVLFIGVMFFALGLAMVLAMRRWRPWGEEGWGSDAMVMDSPAASTGDEPHNSYRREAAHLRLGTIFSDRSIYLYIAAAALSGTASTPLLFPMDDAFVNISATTLAALLSLPALLAVGVLSDRFNRKLVVLAVFAILMIVVIPSLIDLGAVANASAVGLLIAGFGARTPAVLALQWDYFGKRHFGLLYGIQTSTSVLVAAIWHALTGFVADVFGLGTAVFLVWSILPLALALVLIFLMKRPRHESAAAESEPQVAV